jgi:hypothetical protein
VSDDLKKMLAQKKKMTPAKGFNLVGLDDYEKAGEQLFLISSGHKTEAEARAAQKKYLQKNRDTRTFIYGGKGAIESVADEMNNLLAELDEAAPPPSDSEEVAKALIGKQTKTGGQLMLTDHGNVRDESVILSPKNRWTSKEAEERGLDWYGKYASPVKREVEELLRKAKISGWKVDIGDKGHVEVFRQ